MKKLKLNLFLIFTVLLIFLSNFKAQAAPNIKRIFWNGNPGFKFPFREAGPYDYWVSNSTWDEYNVWMTYKGNPKNRFIDYELLSSQPLYKYAAATDFNYNSDKIYGKGSGIFMHITPYSGGGTLGCVGMPEDKLLNILMWMDPSKNPVIIMGPTSELNKM